MIILFYLMYGIFSISVDSYDCDIIIHYIGNKQYTYQQFMKCISDTNCVIGHITSAHFITNTHKLRNKEYNVYLEGTICNLVVNKKFRGQGYGTRLLRIAMDEIKKKNIHVIKLDDMSDRFRKKNNIYVKHGFKYINDNGPDMICYC